MTLDISAIRQRIENSAGRPRTIEDIAHLVVDCFALCVEVERLRAALNRAVDTRMEAIRKEEGK